MLILGVEPRITAYKTIVITVSLYELFKDNYMARAYPLTNLNYLIADIH